MTVLGALTRGREVRAIQATAWGDWGGETKTAATITPTSALQLLTVYGCNRFICDGISTLPVDVMRSSDAGPVQLKVPQWLAQPTPDLDFVAWSTQLLTSWLIAGNAYVVPDYADGQLRNVFPLDPTKVEVFRAKGRKMFRVDGKEVDSSVVRHVPGVMFPGSDVGLSPVEAARVTIGGGMSAEEYGKHFLDQDSNPGGVIEVPGDMAPEKTKQMARDWARAHSGKSKNGLPGVLVGGATWKQVAVTNEQAQFLETRGYTAAQIAAQLFLIDPSEMGLPVQGSSLTYANLEQRNARKVQVTFLPWIVRLEKLVNGLLPAGDFVKLNVNGLLRGDAKTRWETYKIGDDIGAMQLDEIRGLEDLPPLPDEPPPPPALTDQIEAVGQLIRAGFEPDAALAFLGLPPIKHTGLVPITVTQESP